MESYLVVIEVVAVKIVSRTLAFTQQIVHPRISSSAGEIDKTFLRMPVLLPFNTV